MTDSTGKLNFKVRYPKEYSGWFNANVQVSTKVDGTESIQVRSLDFPVAVSDVDINVPGFVQIGIAHLVHIAALAHDNC